MSEEEQAAERAKQDYRRGVAAFREERFDEAVEAFLSADAVAPNAALSFNVAKAYDQLDRPADSLFWYLDYLRRAPDANDRVMVQELIREREAKLAADGKQLLVVVSSPRGAQVKVDGALRGTTPWRAVVEPATYAVTIELEGYTPKEQTIKVMLDQAAVIDGELGKIEEAAAVAPPPPPPIVEPPVAPPPPKEPAPEADTASYHPWQWVALGAGALSLGGAGVFEMLRNGSETDAENATIQTEKAAALSRMDGQQTAARVFLGAGLALTAVGVTLWVMDDSGEQEGGLKASVGSDRARLDWVQSF